MRIKIFFEETLKDFPRELSLVTSGSNLNLDFSQTAYGNSISH